MLLITALTHFVTKIKNFETRVYTEIIQKEDNNNFETAHRQ